MRSVRRLLAALLSLLAVAVPISASACDLVCWLRPTHSDCHAVSGIPENQGASESMTSGMNMDSSKNMASREMTAGMNMGSEGSGVLPIPRVRKGKSLHSMHPQIALAAERLAHNTTPRLSTGAKHSHFAAFSRCAAEGCNQILISASPPGAGQYEPNSPHLVAINTPNVIKVGAELHLTNHRIPPPKNPSDTLTTILRI
jgi:hypothetical protein